MNAIPSYVSDLLVTTFANIQAKHAIAEQAISNTYRGHHDRIIKRDFTLKSFVKDGELITSFSLDEALAECTVRRICWDHIDGVSAENGVLSISCDDMSVSFVIKPEE